MLKFADSDHPVHHPSDADKFVFDAEVSKIFPNMAARSIPMYHEAHRLHVALLLPRLVADERVVIYDIGSSRGQFFKEICNQLQIPPEAGRKGLHGISVDSSAPMLALLKEELPWVTTWEADATMLPELTVPADVISLLYLLQFIQAGTDKLRVLQWAYRNLSPGGMVILGQKEVPSSTFEEMFTSEYYKFRVRNGYTMEEVEAKTRALKNSMWPISPAFMEDMCYEAGFSDYTETTRWLQFSTSVAVKRKE